MKTANFQVAGMMCANCENRVMNALKNIDGITDVSASAKSGTVNCTYEEAKTGSDAIRETIEAVGYDVISAS